MLETERGRGERDFPWCTHDLLNLQTNSKIKILLILCRYASPLTHPHNPRQLSSSPLCAHLLYFMLISMQLHFPSPFGTNLFLLQCRVCNQLVLYKRLIRICLHIKIHAKGYYCQKGRNATANPTGGSKAAMKNITELKVKMICQAIRPMHYSDLIYNFLAFGSRSESTSLKYSFKPKSF